MFTGIIVTQGAVEAIHRTGQDARLAIATPDYSLAGFAEGESIAVAGVCLTALGLTDHRFEADVSVETLQATTLGALASGDPVNIEPSLAIGDRLGGHLVTGHVDCVGTVRRVEPAARATVLEIAVPPVYMRYIARKGSITVDGISLTVNAIGADSFELTIIPHTWDVTTLRQRSVGTHVNIEVDLMARYAERLAAPVTSADSVNREFLREHGYER